MSSNQRNLRDTHEDASFGLYADLVVSEKTSSRRAATSLIVHWDYFNIYLWLSLVFKKEDSSV